MTKIKIIIIVFMLTALNASAQLKGGLKGGMNITDIIITNGASYFGESAFDQRISYHFGSYVQKNLSAHLSLQVEMLFSNKGFNLNADSLSTEVSLNYLNWPVLIEYQLGNRLDFHAGLEMGLLVTGEPLYRSFDLGLDVGMEFDLSKKILLGIRYNHGLPFGMKIESYEYSGEAPRYQHSVVQFFIGYNIVNEPE